MGRVLVTGAAGFTGSAVCREALRQGGEVVGLVRPGELVEPMEGVEYLELDWAGRVELAMDIAGAAPDTIVHCAGATPRMSFVPSALYEANVALCWRLLEAVREGAPSAGVVVLSSAAVYGPTAPSPVAEDTPLRPTSHYGWSKLLCEDAARAFAAADGIRACIARPFNMLGAGEPAGSVVYDVKQQLDEGHDRVDVREVASTRDFIDVDDAASAFLLIAEKGVAGEAYNVCSGEGVTIAALIEAMRAAWDSKADIVVANPDATGSVSVGSCAKLKGLGWQRARVLRDSLAHLRTAD